MDCRQCACDWEAETVSDTILTTLESGSDYVCGGGTVPVPYPRMAPAGPLTEVHWKETGLVVLFLLSAVALTVLWTQSKKKVPLKRSVELESSDTEDVHMEVAERGLLTPLSGASPLA